MFTARLILPLLAGSLLFAGCSAQIISTETTPGSSVTIPLSFDEMDLAWNFDFPTGYGTDQNPDYQRGQLSVFMCATSAVQRAEDCAALVHSDDGDPTNDLRHDLTVRLVTRAHLDPASPAGIRNGVVFSEDFDARILGGQQLAIVEVPAELDALFASAGSLELSFDVFVATRSWIVPAQGAPVLGPEDFTGYTDTRWNLRLVQGDGQPTPSLAESTIPKIGDWAFPGEEVVPFPKLILRYADFWQAGGYPGQDGNNTMAAASLVVQFPETNIQIEDVFEYRHGGRHSIVRWRSLAPTYPDRIAIDLVAPDLDVGELAIAFSPKAPAEQNIVAMQDFTVLESHRYDSLGVELGAPDFAPAGWIR